MALSYQDVARALLLLEGCGVGRALLSEGVLSIAVANAVDAAAGGAVVTVRAPVAGRFDPNPAISGGGAVEADTVLGHLREEGGGRAIVAGVAGRLRPGSLSPGGYLLAGAPVATLIPSR